MPRYRLSRPAQTDLAEILRTSAERWGTVARNRYAATLAAAIRYVAYDPRGPATRDRSELLPGLRSFHSRYAPVEEPGSKVRRPVHVLYYRLTSQGLIEIVRVLHERMEPRPHLKPGAEREE